ncbi:MAG: hypothetical protein B7733_05745 [Myxococcales bacterium FL481]|nr:MAG: hypothetical protein B7733_05745 [Myxococcales bacterium FL481]
MSKENRRATDVPNMDTDRINLIKLAGQCYRAASEAAGRGDANEAIRQLSAAREVRAMLDALPAVKVA